MARVRRAASTDERTLDGDRPTLLTDPFLHQPTPAAVEVAWFTEFAGDAHYVLVGDGVGALSDEDILDAVSGGTDAGTVVFVAETVRLSRLAEDHHSHLPADRRPAAGIVDRKVHRHHVLLAVPPGVCRRYRVVSVQSDDLAASETYSLRGPLVPGEPAVIMLTSDHQLLTNTPANIELAARTITEQLGRIDAVFMAGDMVNVPDRASEWFDDHRGTAFFPVMQGRGAGRAVDGAVYRGAPILQNALLYPALGNHEVQGRRAEHTSLDDSLRNAVPRDVAAAAYEQVADKVNPDGDAAVKSRWIEDNSFSVTTYEEIFSPPRSDAGGKRFYATTVGDVRLIVLFATRMWRPDHADAEPARRAVTTRFQDSVGAIGEPLHRGHGAFLFEGLAVGTPQHDWLRDELRSEEFRAATYTVVMLHEGPHSLGENVMPAFAAPLRVEERGARGELLGVRYEYPAADNILLRDVVPLLESAGVNLVYSGHNHLWNRFVSPSGVHYLESSNTGNTFGAFLDVSRRHRHAPPAPWCRDDVVGQGDPGGLSPVVPTVAPRHAETGVPLPYVAGDDLVVFSALHTGTGRVHSWYVDLTAGTSEPVLFDVFPLR